MEESSYTKRFTGHLKTVNHHRLLVCKYCFKLGLYYQGLTHDLSKDNPVEFLPGVKYWQGYRSPINREKEVIGYSLGWLHHKGKNKHHWEYWIDHKDKEDLKVVRMPYKYVLESFCDRLAASRTYLKDNYKADEPLKYFLNSKDSKILDPANIAEFTYLLTLVKDLGEEEALKRLKAEYKQKKR